MSVILDIVDLALSETKLRTHTYHELIGLVLQSWCCFFVVDLTVLMLRNGGGEASASHGGHAPAAGAAVTGRA